MVESYDRVFVGEPALAELLDDPVIHAVMARDGVERGALDTLIGRVQRRLERRAARTRQSVAAPKA